MPLSSLCPHCGRPVDLLDEPAELWGSDWWAFGLSG